MSTYKCPKGHESTESDYCSECGAKIHGTPELASANSEAARNSLDGAKYSAMNSITSTVPPTPAAQSIQICPACTAPHDPDSGDFCEICGYNFISGAHGEVPPVAIAPTPAAETTNPTKAETPLCEPVTSNSTASKTVEETEVVFEVVATIDPSLREEESPPPPTNQAPITFRLDKESNLIGRTSELRGIYPEVALDFDDAVSHRHALLNRQPDGTFVLRDIGSTNGTKLNGVELAAMVDTLIQDGDEFTLGHWTRIKVKVIR
ncbi:MAG TPA: FHA domain-containing protein [Cyanobacteria bacterium UBA8543]|nr:FHA domain-containing protein [Cyanobacteria bacterium UBA8543]